MGGIFGDIGKAFGSVVGVFDKSAGRAVSNTLGGIGNIADKGAELAPLVGFKKGGKVTKTQMAQVHKGEYVLPAGVKPTKTQMKAVAKGKAKASKASKARGARPSLPAGIRMLSGVRPPLAFM